MENKEAEVMKDEDQEVYEEAFMIDEDKQAICDALKRKEAGLLQHTRYVVIEDIDEEDE